MAKVKGAIVVDTERCKGCELCVISCPTHVIAMSKNVNSKGYHYAYMENPDACNGCTNCAVVCPDGVITVYRMKVEEKTEV
ncbi:MAG TPA: 4Fe-4S dicluster domain-containing protein [Bacteroidetes bacterium]|nr:4Fe-4S dicluster domain-containing protein [Bacteroidota bacterium]